VKQEAEIIALVEKQEVGRDELDKVLESEEGEMEILMEERRRKMSERWRLVTETWKTGRVEVGAIRLPHPIAAVEWPEELVDDGEVEEGGGGDDAGGAEVLADFQQD